MGMPPPGTVCVGSAPGVLEVVPAVPMAPGVPLPSALEGVVVPVACCAWAVATAPSPKTIAKTSRLPIVPSVTLEKRCRRAEVTASGDVARLDPFDAGGLHLLPGGGQRAVEVDGARGVLDHVDVEAEFARIEGGPGDAEIGRQPGHEHGVDAARLQ